MNKVFFQQIISIHQKAAGCRLSDEFFQETGPDLDELAKKFRTNRIQTLFLANVFAMNLENRNVDFRKLMQYLGIGPLEMLAYLDDFEFLAKKNYVIRKGSRSTATLDVINNVYQINTPLVETILDNKNTQGKINDIFDLLHHIDQWTKQKRKLEINAEFMIEQTGMLIEKHAGFKLIRTLMKYQPGHRDLILWLILIWRALNGLKSLDLDDALDILFDDQASKVRYLQSLFAGKNPLTESNLVQLKKISFPGHTIQLVLTNKMSGIIKKCGFKLMDDQLTGKNTKENIHTVLMPSVIPERELIFDPSGLQQLFMLKEIMQDRRLKPIQKRLKSKNLPEGITVLLHGIPGTGKTEAVKQMARETKRKLMIVDISETKSMWFGESEKMIKKIFSEYRDLAKHSKRLPILLFNEADAIISKRRDVHSGNTIQTQNAMQNILLEEIENFEGILIATTNLTGNIDKAFERRFLFKIRFDKPDVKTRAQIWQLKLPFLSPEEALTLAGQFDFSGGQIDNIARKCELQEMIHGQRATPKEIIAFCQNETWHTHTKPIGY